MASSEEQELLSNGYGSADGLEDVDDEQTDLGEEDQPISCCGPTEDGKKELDFAAWFTPDMRRGTRLYRLQPDLYSVALLPVAGARPKGCYCLNVLLPIFFMLVIAAAQFASGMAVIRYYMTQTSMRSRMGSRMLDLSHMCAGKYGRSSHTTGVRTRMSPTQAETYCGTFSNLNVQRGGRSFHDRVLWPSFSWQPQYLGTDSASILENIIFQLDRFDPMTWSFYVFMVAISSWLLVFLLELCDIARFVLMCLNVGVGREKIRCPRRSRFVTSDSGCKIVAMSMEGKCFAVVLGLIRYIIANVVFFAGAFLLQNTVSVADYLLNCVALKFLFELDQLFYAVYTALGNDHVASKFVIEDFSAIVEDGTDNLPYKEEPIQGGDWVFVLADEDKMKRAFDDVQYTWDKTMRTILGSWQRVLIVRQDVVGFEMPQEDEEDENEIWFYPRICVTKEPKEKWDNGAVVTWLKINKVENLQKVKEEGINGKEFFSRDDYSDLGISDMEVSTIKNCVRKLEKEGVDGELGEAELDLVDGKEAEERGACCGCDVETGQYVFQMTFLPVYFFVAFLGLLVYLEIVSKRMLELEFMRVGTICLYMGPTPNMSRLYDTSFPAPAFCESIPGTTCETFHNGVCSASDGLDINNDLTRYGFYVQKLAAACNHMRQRNTTYAKKFPSRDTDPDMAELGSNDPSGNFWCPTEVAKDIAEIDCHGTEFGMGMPGFGGNLGLFTFTPWSTSPSTSCQSNISYIDVDCKPEEDYSSAWSKLSSKRKDAWQKLNWTQKSWDTQDPLLSPVFKTWDKLTADDRSAAQDLCYSSSTWEPGRQAVMACPPIEHNQVVGGRNISESRTTSAKICQKMCTFDPECKAFEWVKKYGTCQLKAGATERASSKEIESGETCSKA